MVEPVRLRQWLTRYQNPDSTYRDITAAVSHYQGLQPACESYTFVDGNTMDLVNLSGTIPVKYKGATYNIPVCIWLIDTHPKNAPICYVKPTPDMSVKVSMFVDQSGRIYLPYLHDWQPGKSDLTGLIQVMIVTFGDVPPVFAKPKNGSNLPYPTNSFMPNPTSYGTPPYPVPYPPTSYVGGPGFPAFPPYPPANPMPPSRIAEPIDPFAGGTIKDEHIRESLMTAIQEKLLRSMDEQYQQNEAEIQTLKKTREELKLGQAKLDEMLSRLTREQKDLDKTITLLKDKEQELNSAIEKIGSQESMDVDDAVTTTTPLYKQLLNAFAEEAAHEDAIYYMGEALRCGVIDLDVFLRQVRSLSRKQFMLRALMQKCRQKAGLPV